MSDVQLVIKLNLRIKIKSCAVQRDCEWMGQIKLGAIVPPLVPRRCTEPNLGHMLVTSISQQAAICGQAAERSKLYASSRVVF